MKFPVYDQSPANTESVIPPLKEIFRDAKIEIITFNSSDLKNGLLREKDTVGFSLPGIIGETSFYTDQIGDSGLREISASVSEGRVMLAICAGAYFICRQTVYEPHWGPHKTRQPAAAIFNAVARGPVGRMGGRFDPEFWPSDLSSCEVLFKSSDGIWRNAAVAYGNGPAFYPDQHRDPALEPLAYYISGPKPALAAASLTHGEGKILLLGVLPHIGWREIAPYPGFERIKGVMEALKSYEDRRQDFQNVIGSRLKDQILTYQKKHFI